MTWLSINSAPKDGTPILACSMGYGSRTDLGIHPRSVKFEIYHPNQPGKGTWRNHLGHKENHLTHWMTLPPDPYNNDIKLDESGKVVLF